MRKMVQVLTQSQTMILEALVNCIIPADDFLNVWDAGVGKYLFRQFQGDIKESGPDRLAIQTALDVAKHFNGKVNLGIRPFDDYSGYRLGVQMLIEPMVLIKAPCG